MTRPAVREPMTNLEVRICQGLAPGRVRYLPGSSDKRIARMLAEWAEAPEPTITPKMREQMSRLLSRYRRQVVDSAVLLELLAGQMMLRQAREEEAS